MPNPEDILTAVRELEPQLPDFLRERAADVQRQISPLIDQLAAGQSDGAELLQVLCAYPVLAKVLQERLGLQQSIDDGSLDALLRDRTYQPLPGTPSSAIPGRRYICPVPECPEDWFRRGNQSPRICEEHGVVMVPATDEG